MPLLAGVVTGANVQAAQRVEDLHLCQRSLHFPMAATLRVFRLLPPYVYFHSQVASMPMPAGQGVFKPHAFVCHATSPSFYLDCTAMSRQIWLLWPSNMVLAVTDWTKTIPGTILYKCQGAPLTVVPGGSLRYPRNPFMVECQQPHCCFARCDKRFSGPHGWRLSMSSGGHIYEVIPLSLSAEL